MGSDRVMEPGSALTTLLRAALPSLPVIKQLPGIKKAPVEGFSGLAVSRPPVRIERSQVDAYAAVCGLPTKDTVPLTYPHLLAFGLQMAIMTDPAFPAPAIGTVHLENSITGHRPIAVGETVAVRASVSAPRAHPKGTTYAFATTITTPDSDEPIWESVSTYLRRGRGDDTASLGTAFAEVDPTGTVWHLAGDLGRRYAAVSGDHNPIHLHPLSARALGFRRQIAHGMWSTARCVAALESRLPDAVRVEVGFRKPIFLPGSVAFGSRPTTRRTPGADRDGYAFSLTDPSSGSTHVLGQTTPL